MIHRIVYLHMHLPLYKMYTIFNAVHYFTPHIDSYMYVNTRIKSKRDSLTMCCISLMQMDIR